MSTNDVPGAKPENRDQLAMGCWAEHDDGSLILVESTEGGRIVYSIFDVARKPITEYRDAMAEGAFKKQFSWKGGADIKWTWHDKTAFPWDRIIREGARDGARFADVEEQLSAAERVRRSREIQRGTPVDPDDIAHRFDQLGDKAEGLISRLQMAISKLSPGKKAG